MKFVIFPAGLIFVLLATGCSKSPQGDPQDPAYKITKTNPKMNAAMETARQTLPQFVKVLKSGDKNCSQLAVKHGFKDGGQVEHMWVEELKFDGQKFSGVMVNTPEMVSNVKLGDSVTIPKEEISDWMYLKGGKLYGGYTMRVIRDEMSPEEQKQFDAEVGFKFD